MQIPPGKYKSITLKTSNVVKYNYITIITL